MTGELKKYEVVFRMKIPGNVKEADYTITVGANNPEEAQRNGIDVWKQETDPRDIRVREVAKVITAS